MKYARNIYRPILNKRGFSLIEIVIVLVLTSMTVITIYMIYNSSLAIYKETEEQIDAQSQFRLIIGILEEEVGTATEVHLMQKADLPDPIPDGYKCIYVKMDDDGEYGKFYSRTSAGETEFETPYPLKQLSMSFRQGTSKNVLEVYLEAEGTNDYAGSILTRNTNLIYITLMQDYEAVYYKVLDL